MSCCREQCIRNVTADLFAAVNECDEAGRFLGKEEVWTSLRTTILDAVSFYHPPTVDSFLIRIYWSSFG